MKELVASAKDESGNLDLNRLKTKAEGWAWTSRGFRARSASSFWSDARVVAYPVSARWSFSGSLPEGSSVNRTFNRVGTFRYYCTIHGSVSDGKCSGMCGCIEVR